MRIKRIAFLVYPRLTLLDLVGVYDALRRVARAGIDRQLTHRVVGTEAELADDSGFVVRPDGVYEDPTPFDLLVVPGGLGVRSLLEDLRCIDYLRSWGKDKPIASVCSGALLLGAAGHLAGLRATTHARNLEELQPYCREVSTDRIVDEGRVVTAAGGAASLDLGIHLVGKHWGDEAAVAVAQQMEYRGTVSSR